MDRAFQRERLLLIWPGRIEPDKVLAQEIVSAGVDILEYRPEEGEPNETVYRALERLRNEAPLIVNNRLTVAKEVDGVWVGEGDIAVASARKELGEDARIGRTVRSVKSLEVAEREGADWVGAGALSPSPLKRDAPLMEEAVAREIANLSNTPCFGVGGVLLGEGVETYLLWGFRRFALSGAILRAKNPPFEAMRWQNLLAENLTNAPTVSS
ncbi:thiamine phosphate synthase [bacterium]|nr:thiamine phosphate synthase [bacterium]